MRSKWIHMLCVWVLSLFVVACNAPMDEPEASASGKTRKIVLRLSIDDVVRSRASWEQNDTPEQGNAMENRINLNGLRVVIFSVNADGTVGNRLGTAQHMLYWNIDEPVDGSSVDIMEYQLVADVSDVLLETANSYRFMVYANFPNSDNNRFGLADVDVNDGYIPMWGVTTYQIKGNELEDLGTIDMLRAAAKVEVKFTTEFPSTDYDITGVAIKNHSETGNNLPTGWNNCANTKALDMENCINVTANHKHEPLSFFQNKVVNADGSVSYTIYLPEYSNVSHVEDKSVVQVTLKKKGEADSKTYNIPFCKYSPDGIPVLNEVYNVVRNHIYQFNVKGVAAGSLLLNFNVADWTKSENVPTLGNLAYPTYVNPLLPTREFDYKKDEIPTSPEMAIGEPFAAWFHFLSANGTPPTGEYAWKPTMLDNSPENYQILVYKDGDESMEVYDSNDETNDQDLKTVYEGWFLIKVIPEKSERVNDIFTLGISCSIHPSGFPSENFFLFINGENDDIAWPNSGNDRKFIAIKQVAPEIN